MKTLLFGSAGQLGTELQSGWNLGELVPVSRAECDLRNGDSIRQVIRREAPEIILNAAAYTAVDRAEAEIELCLAVNGVAPGIMADEAGRLGALLVHYSTDYVFDGTKAGAYSEEDAVNPQNAYGKSKLEGERAIEASRAEHLIFRTSWVFSPHGTNFVKTMLRLGRERDRLKVVNDQFGAPTSAKAIALATSRILSSGKHKTTSGLYHMTAAGEVSWAGFAEEIFRQSRLPRVPVIEPIPGDEYPTPARRPKNSRLSNDKFAAAFGFRLSDWREQLRETLSTLLPELASQNSVKENGHRR